MPDSALGSWDGSKTSNSVFWTHDWRGQAVTFAFGLVTGVAAHLIVRSGTGFSVLSLLTTIGAVIGAWLVAIALLRFIDAMVRSRERSLRADRVAFANEASRKVLEVRTPGVAGQASAMDADALVDRKLSPRG